MPWQHIYFVCLEELKANTFLIYSNIQQQQKVYESIINRGDNLRYIRMCMSMNIRYRTEVVTYFIYSLYSIIEKDMKK